ncbi:MAG: hypothetical protein VB140_10325, partial [Burkholderia sp.]
PFASASSTAWRTSLVRNPFVSPELCPSDAIASSRSIYATTPRRCCCVLVLEVCKNAGACEQNSPGLSGRSWRMAGRMTGIT